MGEVAFGKALVRLQMGVGHQQGEQPEQMADLHKTGRGGAQCDSMVPAGLIDPFAATALSARASYGRARPRPLLVIPDRG